MHVVLILETSLLVLRQDTSVAGVAYAIQVTHVVTMELGVAPLTSLAVMGDAVHLRMCMNVCMKIYLSI
jgi:hypothetical protein